MKNTKQVPKIAIITRTKNRNILLERAIKSVLSQTSKDYVHVVLNDGGDKEGVERLLSKYPDKNRHVIHNQKSVGLTPALNQAIRAVDSEYVSILDDDDTWHAERLAKVTRYLKDHPDEPGVAVVMDRIVESIEEDGSIREHSRDQWYGDLTVVNLYDQLLDNYLTNNCITYARTLYEELNGYDETLEVAEDWDFGIRYLLKYDIYFIPGVLAYYHHRPDANGEQGNSVFTGIDKHKRSLTKLRNRYLREDIENGRFGIGFMMNNLNDLRSRSMQQALDEDGRVVRIEGHINSVASRIDEELKVAIDRASLFKSIKDKINNKKRQ